MSSVLLNPQDPGLPWPWFPLCQVLCGTGSGPKLSRQRETGVGRKAVGSSICCPSLGVQGAVTGAGVPAPLPSPGRGCAQRLLWADTPSLGTMGHCSCCLGSHNTPQFHAHTASIHKLLAHSAGGRSSVTPLTTSACPPFFEVALAKGTPVLSQRTQGVPPSLPALSSLHPFSAWPPNTSPCPQPDLTMS